MTDTAVDATPSATGGDAQPDASDGGVTVNPLQQKYEEYSQVLATNPEDFQTWTYLLSTVERLNEMSKIVEVFDAFLQAYPLCYGYWKKYADAAMRHLGLSAATEVYERGLASVPYSVDLWGHYITFRMTKSSDEPDAIRGLFERGLAFVETDYLSHPLWDKYFQFEMDQGQMQNVAQLYGRVLSVACKELEGYHGKYVIPRILFPPHLSTFDHWMTEGLSHTATQNRERLFDFLRPDLLLWWHRFVQFAAEQELSAVMSPTDVESYKQQLKKKRAENREDPSNKAAEMDGDVQMQENSTPKPSEIASGDSMDIESMEIPSEEATKEFWIQSMAELYEKTSQQLTIRRQFEDCIKRPYFHVKPLDNIQLQAWWKYLDAVYSKGDHREIVILFERCLVACASYPEFWMRYVLYMEPIDALEAMNVVKRAVQVFCRNKSEMHLFAAHFYERRGDVQSARSTYENVTSTLTPALLTGILQHAEFEYRQDAPEKANELYEAKIQAELETENSEIIAFLATQYGYVQFRRFGAKDKARQIVDQVLAKRPDLLSIWEGAIQLEELIHDDASVQRVIALYQRCISQKESDEGKPLELQDRCTMSARLLNYLNLHGEIHTYGEMHRQHLELFGLCSIAPSLHRKRSETTEADNAAAKVTSGESTTSATETKAASAVTSAAMSEYFAQNPAAQQYAQYYQYAAAAAAAAAGYGSYPGYNTPSSYST